MSHPHEVFQLLDNQVVFPLPPLPSLNQPIDSHSTKHCWLLCFAPPPPPPPDYRGTEPAAEEKKQVLQTARYDRKAMRARLAIDDFMEEELPDLCGKDDFDDCPCLDVEEVGALAAFLPSCFLLFSPVFSSFRHPLISFPPPSIPLYTPYYSLIFLNY